jgi:predicted nucleic acid-binding protein
LITGIDTNILIDVLEPDPTYGPASREALKRCLHQGPVFACEVVWAEVATVYSHKEEEAVDVLRRIGIEYSAITLEAALEAAKCWAAYRKKSKTRDRIVADFLIGGHALVLCDRLLTRDRGFYRNYFKSLKVECP